MRCPSCMETNPAGNRFCENCGEQLRLTCRDCGHDVSPNARFCGNCGSSLSAAIMAASAGPAAPRWGELKQATVLFADIVGSTELVADLDPEEAMARLRPAVLAMRHSVERFGGTIVRTLGDGVMALFGVPRTLEGHALLACQAALHMQQAFARGAGGLSIRVGLHSGLVASDPQDAEDGRGGGAHGVTIHLASRVVALAKPGGICLTPACRTAAGPRCRTESLGNHMLKGIPEAVEILGLVGTLSENAAQDPSVPQSTTFQGREAELAQLLATLDGRGEGAPNVIGVAGEPGAGKSRLCHEFAQQCAERGIPVFEVRAQLYGHALPLQPVLELFRVHFFGIQPQDDAQAARGKIAMRFAPLGLTDGDLALLYEFFGVADSAHEPLGLGPAARQARLLGLVKDLVRIDADKERVILMEDLHWLDEASEEFVSALVDAVAGTRTLLLLNYRLTYRCLWLQASHFEQIALGELPGTHMEALVGELLAPLTMLPEVRRLVCQRAAGNPFFAEELVRTLAESHLFVSPSDLPKGGLEAVEQALPANVQAVVGARLDRLGEPERTFLQMCAIIGKEIPLAVLRHVASPIANQIERGLAGLIEAGLIVPQQHSTGERSFAFRHPLIQEVAYSAQLKVRRGEVHASVAAAMELYYEGRLDEFAGLIAYHFEQAQQHFDAARYMARAATWVASKDSARAVFSWRKVRSLLEQVPASPEADHLRVLACGKIAWLSWREGLPMDEVMPFIREARALAGNKDARIIRLLLFLEGRMLQANGGPVDRYAELVGQAMAMLEADAPPGSKVLLNTALCQAYGWAGMFTKALAASDAALEGAASVDRFEEDFIGFSLRQWAMVLRGRLLVRLGRPQEAMQCLQTVTGLEPQAVDPVLLQIAHYGLVEAACALQDTDAAQHHADLVSGIAARQGGSYLAVFAHACRGLVAFAREEFESAFVEFHRALELVRQDNVAKEFETELLVCLAECRYVTADMESAHDYCAEAIESSRWRNNRHQHVRALMIASAVVRARDESAGSRQAQELLAQAGELVRATGASALSFRVKVLPEAHPG